MMKMLTKYIVIKLGGSSLSSANTLTELATTVQGYRSRGYKVVIVHGGGPAINEELSARGITWTFVNGQRRTTKEMIDVIDTVLSQTVNLRVVESLRSVGLPAKGLSGAADGLLICTQLNRDLGLVGQVESVDTAPIAEAVRRGEVPVIAPVGRGQSREVKFNVNADWAAAKIAIALNASKLIFLTDQNGILDQDKCLVRSATPAGLEAMIASGVVSGGMCTKVLAMMAAIEHGVGQVRVLNAAQSSGSLNRARVGTILTVAKLIQPKDVMHGYAS
jgi:acetylglutamate kinase